MKHFVLSFMVLVGNSVSAHASMPSCWTESQADIKDGEFIARIDTQLATKQDILLFMKRLKTRNLRPAAFPNIYPTSLFVMVKAGDFTGDRVPMSRDEVKTAAEIDLGKVLDITGVAIECNGLQKPLPAVVVGN